MKKFITQFTIVISLLIFPIISNILYANTNYRWAIKSDSKVEITDIKIKDIRGNYLKLEYNEVVDSPLPAYISFTTSRYYDDLYLDIENVKKVFEELNSIKGLKDNQKIITIVISPKYPRELTTILAYNAKKRIDLKYYTSRKGIKGEFAQQGRDLRKSLKSAYEEVKNNSKELNKFLEVANISALKGKSEHHLPFYLANYTTKLLIKLINDNELGLAKKLIENYADKVIVHTGYDQKSTDVASVGIVLVKELKDDKLFNKIEKNILGDDFDIIWEENDILLFNLACYYSLKKDKNMMLKAVQRARELGKPKEQFLSDKDFKFYYKDPEFLKAII